MFVRAPHCLPLDEIECFIAKKSHWLKQKLLEQKLSIQNTTHSAINYTQGSKILYLGEEKCLDIQFQKTSNIEISEQYIDVTLSKRQQKSILSSEDLALCVKQQLARFFNQQLQEYLSIKLPVLIEKLQLYPTKHKVRLYKSRWGSCNSRGELSFNYLLMMTPTWVIDYVIIHELCHLQHLNHSAHFWNLVSTFEPNYKQAKHWLKENQTRLVWN